MLGRLAVADRAELGSDHDGGRTAVVVPDARLAAVTATLTGRADFGLGDDALDAPVAVLTAREAKGLEFDHVLVVDPDVLSGQARHGSDAYVACTRATRTLHLVTLVPESLSSRSQDPGNGPYGDSVQQVADPTGVTQV